MKKLFRKYPLFLVLLPLFIIAHIEREYHRLIEYKHVYGEIIFLLLIPPFVYLISWLLTRNHRKAGVLAFALQVVYYFFGEIKDAIKASWPETIWQSYTFLLAVFLVLLTALTIWIRRRKTGFNMFYIFVNTVLTLFVLNDLGYLIWKSFSDKDPAPQQFGWKAGSCSDCTKPDIYYLIFDSYTSSQFLNEKFGFDNKAIDSALTERGFRIIAGSRSNYNLTPFSMGSVFHLNYLPDVDTIRDYYLRNYLPGVGKVYESPFFTVLQQMGYEIHNHSIFDIRSYPTSVPSFDIWGLKTIYQQHNLIKKLDRDIGWNFPRWLRIYRHTLFDYAADRDRHDSIALRNIRQSISRQSAKPKFVYGHLFIPHSPYTFDAEGNKIQPIARMPLQDDMRAYVEQIKFVNRIMTELTDSILASKKASIIIIQGDHGYRFFDTARKQWEFPNFNAIYFPNGDYHLLHDSLTNVNTLRVVGNIFFKQQYPLLEARTHFLQYK